MRTRSPLAASLIALLLLPLAAAGPTPSLYPSAPQDLTAVGGIGRIDLDWEPPTDRGLGVTAYRVYRDGVLVGTTNVTAFSDRGLNVSTTHSYHVRAVSIAFEGAPSANATATTSSQPPAPVGLVASGGVRAVSLRWFPQGGEVFRVYRDGAFVAQVNARAYNDTGLADATSYVYHVSAVSAGVEGPLSAPANATTLAPPPAPTNLTATGAAGAIDLQWASPRSSGNLTFRVYADLGGWTLLGETNRTTFRDAPVPAGETRTYRVTAVNAVGEGAASNTASATAYGVPSAPQDLQATAANHSIQLSWDAPADDGGAPLQEYRVYEVLPNGTHRFLGRVNASATTYQDLTVAPGDARTYVVRAANAAGEGPSSNQATATRPGLATRADAQDADAEETRRPLRILLRIDAEA